MKGTNPFLWQIDISNFGHASFIFGTMHIAEGEDIPSMDFIKSSIDACSLFANEMNLNHHHLIEPEAFHSAQHLSGMITPKQYKKLRAQLLKSFEIDLDTVGNLKPLIITNLLAEVVLGKSGCIGLDRYLFEYAQSKNIATTGIEMVKEQATIMSSIPMDYQIKALRDIGKRVSKFRKSILDLNDLYHKGEVARLHKKAKKSLGKMRKPLLYDRNIVMANRIADLVRKDSVFVCIGAGHLFGSKGVLRLLKQKGLQVSLARP